MQFTRQLSTNAWVFCVPCSEGEATTSQYLEEDLVPKMDPQTAREREASCLQSGFGWQFENFGEHFDVFAIVVMIFHKIIFWGGSSYIRKKKLVILGLG